MPMTTNKKRRREFRRALAESHMVRPDRFTETMNAIAGGGTQACECCGLQVWVNDLGQGGVCPSCVAAFGRLRVPKPRLVVTRLEPNVVWVDASFADGVAGLAVVGALGEHTQRVEAVSSTQAETMALRWAMSIAERGNVHGLTFRTDCQAAYKVLKQTPKSWGWAVEQVPRAENRRADHLAGAARLKRGPDPSSTGPRPDAIRVVSEDHLSVIPPAEGSSDARP